MTPWRAGILRRDAAARVMKTSVSWSPAPSLNVVSVQRGEQAWTVTVDSRQPTSCPGCGTQSKSRHSAYSRTLRDLSAQGAPVVINARLARWRCRNQRCDRRIFTERLPGLAAPFARQTVRLAGIVRLLGHSAGGRPSERLMRRLGMPVSDTTILRSLKAHARVRSDNGAVRVAGIDDWAWRKGANYGTIIVDLERRQVVGLLAARSAATTASWFKDHPEVEVVSRDRAGLYAEAARQGAPQARQVADRFHLLQNFRETVERQLGRFEAPISDSQVNARDNQAAPPLPARSDCASDAATQKRLMRRGRQAVRQELFDEIRALFEGGSSVREIARKLGLGRRRVERWVRRIDLPDLNTMASKPCTPAYFGALLARRWAGGITKVRHLFAEIRHRGYTGSYSHLARFLAPWRSCQPSFDGDEQVRAEQEEPTPVRVRTLDPMTGRAISPQTAAALCVKPRGQMTARQVANVDALKAASAEFTAMRHLAMRFRGLLRGGTLERLDAWLIDARASGIYAMQRFARTIRQDLEAVRSAVLEPWSNGQTEGQINKLKALKRAMYGRAGVDLLRARMMPL
jgi:transposase